MPKKALTSPGTALGARTAAEVVLERALMALLDRFLEGVLDDAKEALKAVVLVAAAPRPRTPGGQFIAEPFSFTRVNQRWTEGIRWLAKNRGHIVPVDVLAALRESDLPMRAFESTTEILTTAKTEEWSTYKTKVELRKSLVPKPGETAAVPGPARESFKANIRMIARTAATAHYNSDVVQDLANSQFTGKRWVTRHDKRVRDAHRQLDGSVVALGQPFSVDGFTLDYPGDDNAPAYLTANCRCVLIGADAQSAVIPMLGMTAGYTPTMRTPLGLIASLTSTILDEGCAPCREMRENAPAHDPVTNRALATTARQAAAAAVPEVAAPVAPAEPEGDTQPGWEGTLVVEGEMTGDGRLIENGALVWDLPMPIRYVSSDVGAHDGAEVVGHILTATRKPDGIIWATGDWDMGSEVGREAFRQVDEDLTTGISVDLDDVSFEIRLAADVAAEMDAMMEDLMGEDEEPSEEAAEPEEREVDDEGRVTVMEMGSDDEVFVTTSGRIRAATIVAIPAFTTARIATTGQVPAAAEPADPALAAAGRVARMPNALADPPAAWFANPGLSEPTPLVVTAEGRVYGHIAAWNVCHTSHTSQGRCVLAPRNRTGYSAFRTGSVLLDNGSTVATGRLTIGTGHAGETLSAAQASSHYDNTGTAAADVACGDDEHGIWVAGYVRPGTPATKVKALRASPISGDWRTINGNLELVAALGVNVPGFPIPKPHGLVASGQLATLVAAGMLPPTAEQAEDSPLSLGDLRHLKRLADRERTTLRDRFGAVARERKADRLRERVLVASGHR